MASGKSTIGRELADKLSYKFIDLDDYIVEQEQKSVPEIFKTKGEIYFRKKETEYLQQVLTKDEKLILSLGGGTPCYGNNLRLILDAPEMLSIYLKYNLQVLVNRLINESGTRPLISHIKTKEDLTEFIGKHLFERQYYYEQAHLKIDCNNLSKDEVLEQILIQLF